MEIHWKAPLQAKGFLKIIEIIVAILALSLVAGFSVSANTTCIDPLEDQTITLSTDYPFRSFTVTFAGNNVTTESHSSADFSDKGISQSAQFFVAWGSLSMIYGFAAIAVYMLFTANENLEKVTDFIIYADLVFHAVWVLCWLIASIEWAVAYNKLQDDIENALHEFSDAACDSGGANSISGNDDSNYVQAAIAVVFGFLSFFLWAVNIAWVVIDTRFYIEWKARRAGGMY